MAMKTSGKGTATPSKVQLQRESAAAMAKSREGPATPNVVEPTWEERVADINRRAREQAEREIAQLVQGQMGDAERAFAKAISNTTDDAVRDAYEKLQRMRKMLGKGSTNGEASGGTTRVRRSAEDLASDAAKLADYLRANPNSKGSVAIEATGAVVKPPLNVKTFIEKYFVGKIKVKTEGQKAGTTYSIG
jgi:hypothetical protein